MLYYDQQNNGIEKTETKMTARQIFEETLKYELYNPINSEQQKRKQQVLKDLNSRIEGLDIQYNGSLKSQLETEVLVPCSFDWRLFSAVINSAKNITQKNGEDDYVLLSFEPQEKILYVAREMFLGLPLELVEDFIFSELKPGLISKNFQLEDFKQDLIKKCVIPYTLVQLVETLIDWTVEERISSANDQEISQDRVGLYTKRLEIEIEKIFNTMPRNIKDFTRFLENARKRNPYISNEKIVIQLRKMGIWNAKLHRLLRHMRINLEDGDTEELFFNSSEYRIIKQELLVDSKYFDEWLKFEEKDFLEKYENFIDSLRTVLADSQNEYNTHIQARDIEKARKVKDSLFKLKEDFSELLDPNTHQFVCELDLAIKYMGFQNP